MKNILIVDDNKINLASARNALSDKYKVTAVLRAQQAIDYLNQKNQCDIILLDINMPEMDGFELLEKIRKIDGHSDTPVIFLTGDTDYETETRCFNAGALDFIVKPFVPEVMRVRIGRILEIEELRQSLANRLEQKMREVSDIQSKLQQDALTGLWNRSYVEEIAGELIARGESGTLLMMDMDNFKTINDSYGHIAGDRTLRMFADTLRDYAGQGDVICRIGGDEFVMFIKGEKERRDIENCAAGIIHDFSAKLEESGFETRSSVSIGIAQTPQDGEDYQSVYNCADKALYYVKQNGKNLYHFYSDQTATEDKRAGRMVDINYIIDLMDRSDTGNGAYHVDFDSFHHVYNFIHRFVRRNNNDAQTILFTIYPQSDDFSEHENEAAVSMLEQAIYSSLRRADVSTRYSSRQIVAVLIDLSANDGDKVAKRIIDNFKSVYKGKPVRVEYDMAKMEGGMVHVPGRN